MTDKLLCPHANECTRTYCDTSCATWWELEAQEEEERRRNMARISKCPFCGKMVEDEFCVCVCGAIVAWGHDKREALEALIGDDEIPLTQIMFSEFPYDPKADTYVEVWGK
jgi:hypothetical protein